MTAAALTAFQLQANTTRNTVFGRTIKVAGADVTAVFTAPRLVATLEESTARQDRYHAIVRILKADVPTLLTSAQWIDDAVVIQLPESTGYRTYRLIMQPTDCQLSSEWRLEVESL